MAQDLAAYCGVRLMNHSGVMSDQCVHTCGVSMCECVRVCVISSIIHVFFSPVLTLHQIFYDQKTGHSPVQFHSFAS